MRIKLLLLALLFIGIFALFSFTVAKEKWTKVDFDTTVKLQDHISRKFDAAFSYYSLLGSVELTLGICLILAFLSLLKLKWLAILGWLMILPASLAEVFGKLVLFHPGPPVFFRRSLLPTSLPSFYIHTNFSYPSGHITRTIFIITILICGVLFSKKNSHSKFTLTAFLVLQSFMMILTRIYLGEHWLSDTIGGGLLGIAVGLFASIFILL